MHRGVRDDRSCEDATNIQFDWVTWKYNATRATSARPRVSIVTRLILADNLRPLTSSTTKYKSHDSKNRLQLSSPDYPHDRHDNYSNSDQYGYDGKLFGPQSLLEFKPDRLSTFTGFELCKPVDSFMGGVYVVGVGESMHEGMICRVIFCGFGIGDAVGRVLREEEKSALDCSTGITRIPLFVNWLL